MTQAAQTAFDAKLAVPTTRGVVPRARLIDALDSRAETPICWIVAGAGYGKTTLAADYARQSQATVVWCRLGEAEGTPGQLIYMLRAAAMRALGEPATALPALGPEYALGLETFGANFFAALQALAKAPLLLVLDDFHTVEASEPLELILRGAAEAIEPARLRLLICGRHEPLAGWSGLIASRQLTLIDQDQLAFSEAEIESYLAINAQAVSQEPVPGLAKRLYAISEGWISGIALAIDRAASTGKAIGAEEPHEREAAFDYFVSQVLEREEPQIRDFLLRTALLPEIQPDLVDSWLGRTDSRTILDQLVQRRLFTQRLGSAETDAVKFRYHDLFRGALGETWAIADDERALLLRSAGALFEAREQGDEAALLYIASQAWDELAALVARLAALHFEQGRGDLIESWLDAFPEARLNADPQLLLWRGICLGVRDGARARALLADAYEMFKAQGATVGAAMAWSAIVETIWMGWAEVHEFDPWIDEFFAHPELFDTPMPDGLKARIAGGIFTALYLRRPDHPAFSLWSATVDAIFSGPMPAGARAMFGFILVYHYAWIRGDRSRIAAILETLRNHIGKDFDALPAMSKILYCSCEASLAFFFGERPEDCFEWVDRSVAVAAETGVHIWDAGAVVPAISAALALEDVPRAKAYYDVLRGAYDKTQPGFAFIGANYAAHIAWQEGRHDDARELVDAIVDMGERNGGYLVRLYAYVPAATYAFAAGERSLACRMVGRARRLARAGDSRVMEFAICVVAAYFAFRDGRRKRALAYLRRVLEIGEVERYLAFPWMRPHMLSSLCGLALAELGPSEYLAQLIAARNIAPPAEAELRRNWPWPCRISVLGPFAVSVDGTPAAFGRKANRRLMVLLQALVLAGPEGAAQEQLIDRIWGESNGTSGAYRAALHRLRALLGSENAVLVTDGRVRLKPDHCWVDAWELEASAVDGADPALFRGPPMLAHLGSYEAAIWAERMRALHARAVEARAVALGAAEDWPAMLAAYRDALAVNPLAEAFYRGKMQAHAALAEPAEISRTLEECRQALAGELDVAISAKTEALAERLLIVPNP